MTSTPEKAKASLAEGNAALIVCINAAKKRTFVASNKIRLYGNSGFGDAQAW